MNNVSLYPVNTVIRALRQHAEDIATLTRQARDPNSDTYYDTANTLHAVIDILVRWRGATRVRMWMDRRACREKLKKVQHAAYSQAGQIAIKDLFEFTITSLEADVAFRPEVDVKGLPMPQARERSEAQRAATAKARAAKAKKREQEAKRRADRRKAEGLGGQPPTER